MGGCPNGCSGNGRCVAPTIPLTAISRAPHTISHPSNSEHGVGRLSGMAAAGGCECDAQHTGHDCSLLRCPSNCHGHGTCVNGTCVCDAGYQGDACDYAECMPPCRNGGVCAGGGVCRCGVGFIGHDCSIPHSGGGSDSSDSSSSGRGGGGGGGQLQEVPVSLSLQLTPPLSLPPPPPLPRPDCPHGGSANLSCAGRGTCQEDGRCACTSPWLPPRCELGACPGPSPRGLCSGHGYCNASAALCTCKPGFAGADCSTPWCPRQCSGRGRCDQRTGRCACDPPFSGLGCELLAPAAAATAHGTSPSRPSPPLQWLSSPPPPPSPSSAPPSPSSPCPSPPSPPPPPPPSPPPPPPPRPKPPRPLRHPPQPPPIEPEDGLFDVPSTCPFACGARDGRGVCRGGTCYCSNGWGGAACQLPLSAAVLIGGGERRWG
jgi:hypothetical protein